MNKEEQILIKRFGKKEPFKVPDGYFDDFTSKLMERLPERPEHQLAVTPLRSRQTRLWRFLSVAAALVCAMVMGATLYLGIYKTHDTTSVALNSHDETKAIYGDFDQMADYTMADNEDFYAYVAGY